MCDRRRLRQALTLCVAVAVSACGNVTHGVRVATHTTLTVPNAAPSPELVAKHCPFGLPEKLPAVRGWVKDGVVKNARMITGGFFYDPAEDDPATADGVIVFEQIGDGNVAVPTHVFKLVVGEGSNGEVKAIAFVAENKKPTNGWRFADGIVSIDWLELRSGLNFMPELDPSDEAALEASTSPIWGQ